MNSKCAALVLFSLAFCAFVVPNSSALGIYTGPVTCSWADSQGLSSSRACDKTEGNFWESTNTAYPHWIVFNLTANQTIDGVSLQTSSFGEQPATYLFQRRNSSGSPWFTFYSSARLSACNVQTWSFYRFTEVQNLSQFRIYGASSGCGGNFMHLFEIHISIGEVTKVTTVLIPDFTIFIVLGTIFVLSATLGFAKRSPAVLIVSAISGYFTAFQSFGDLSNVPITILIGGIASFVLVMSIGMLSNRERV